ncbi:MAG: hypothetical protein C0592_10740 [Marinilabiliales bacterium]|nr:MAG: hypothetical protein C0592_10740 [Marinilabiliales bacterium]
MKKFFTLICLAVSFSLFAQTTIPNAGFENWTSQGSYVNPDSWDSPNEISSTLGIAVVEPESSIVYEGSYSAKISVKNSIGGPLPGVLTLGDFDFSFITMTATIDGGTPFTGRPDRFSGWFQYTPNNNDECFFGVMLLKENAGNYDTVGTAGVFINQTVLTWTYFDTIIDYRTSDTPTHLNIIIMPSNEANPQVNSVMLVDALEFHYTSDINEHGNSNLNIYNDGNFIHFPNLDNNEKTIHIYDLNGRLIKESVQTETKISVADMPEGMYIIKLQNSEGSYSAKFIR